MKKKVIGFIKLQIFAGKANPSPPIGPALGQKGLNIMDFCKQFNSQTLNIKNKLKLPVIITFFSDKTFKFIIKSPPVTNLIKEIINIKKGSNKPHINKVGTININQIKEIVKKKKNDLTASNLNAAINTIIGSIKSMGVKINY